MNSEWYRSDSDAQPVTEAQLNDLWNALDVLDEVSCGRSRFRAVAVMDENAAHLLDRRWSPVK